MPGVDLRARRRSGPDSAHSLASARLFLEQSSYHAYNAEYAYACLYIVDVSQQCSSIGSSDDSS